jgi:uncharacterized membrane protein
MVLVFGSVVSLMNGIYSTSSVCKTTFTLSGSTCLVLLPLTARAVECLRVRLTVVSVVTLVLSVPLSLPAGFRLDDDDRTIC